MVSFYHLSTKWRTSGLEARTSRRMVRFSLNYDILVSRGKRSGRSVQLCIYRRRMKTMNRYALSLITVLLLVSPNACKHASSGVSSEIPGSYSDTAFLGQA